MDISREDKPTLELVEKLKSKGTLGLREVLRLISGSINIFTGSAPSRDEVRKLADVVKNVEKEEG